MNSMKILALIQLVIGIMLSLAFGFNCIRALGQDLFIVVMFGILTIISIALIRWSWKDLKES